ncbi:taurine catabolism dioxygenase TauD [Periconia macrospinosa]|uniref:Taurine catabolism dioxygenase TauD n=1 Tax=Periconia macrospinosa TaxID=97972 RepID=A0A2V1DKZ3_9PLEO|nr:taurine catabolism dioxygenase TauD [Periconia macrospinosa]
MPAGFPTTVASPQVWRPDEIAALQDEWILQLSPLDIDAIKLALANVKQAGISPKQLTPDNFCLPHSLRERLTDVGDSLHMGLGFGLLRGLNPKEFSMEENIIIYAGITSYIADQRAYISPNGTDVLAHIRDLGDLFNPTLIKSPAYTNSEMTFHTDLGDIVTLYTLEKGKGGGSFRLASSGQIYNTLVKSRPDILRTLSQDFLFDSMDSAIGAYRMPLLHHHGERIFLQSFRRPFTGFGDFKRSKDLPAVDAAQMEALNVLHFTAKEHSIKIDFQNGDIMAINNLALLHARDKFVETESSTGNPRHLLKLFQRDSKRAWELPLAMRPQWAELFGHRGEGERQENFPVEYPTQLDRGQVPASGWSQNG